MAGKTAWRRGRFLAASVCNEFSRRDCLLATLALSPHELYLLRTNLVDFPHVLHKVLRLHGPTIGLGERADDHA